MYEIRFFGGTTLASLHLGLTGKGDFAGFAGATMLPSNGDGATIE